MQLRIHSRRRSRSSGVGFDVLILSCVASLSAMALLSSWHARDVRTPYRVIYAVRFDLGGVSLVVPLNRQGQPLYSDTLDGTPRPPKRRTIDLRIGDYVSLCGTWRRINGVSADCAGWMTEQQAIQYRGDGFVYLPRTR